MFFDEACLRDSCGVDAVTEYMEVLLPGAISVWSQLASAFQVLLLFCVLQFGEIPNPKRGWLSKLMYGLYMLMAAAQWVCVFLALVVAFQSYLSLEHQYRHCMVELDREALNRASRQPEAI